MKTEQNNIEQQIKDGLAGREIQPSKMAWDRLDAMLSVAEETQTVAVKKRNSFVWLKAAAAFVAFLLAGVVMLNIEEQNKSNIIIKEGDGVVATPAAATTNTTEAPAVVTAPQLTEEGNITTVNAVVKQQPKGHGTVAVSQPKTAKGGNLTNNAAIVKSNPVNQPATTVAAVTDQQQEAQPSRISVDSAKLLASIEGNNPSEIANVNKPTVKVNSKSLLNAVEGELNEGFRSKALNTAIKNYNTVKTAVANRNYE